jgi:DNA-directed RNA polymerase subunit RPC12/RpoP
MAIKFFCMSCGKKLAALDEHAGQSLRCPACGYRMTAPSQTPREESHSPNLPEVPPVLTQIRLGDDERESARVSAPATRAGSDAKLLATSPAIASPFWRRPIAIVGGTVSLLMMLGVLVYVAWPRDLVLVRRSQIVDQSRARTQNPPLLAEIEPAPAPVEKPVPLAAPEPIAPSKPIEDGSITAKLDRVASLLRDQTTTRDYSRWELDKTLRWDFKSLNCVAFSPDGRTIAVGGGANLGNRSSGTGGDPIEIGLVQLWNVETGEARLRIPEPDNEVRSVTFYPDGSSLAIGNRREVKIVDAKTGTLRFALPMSGLEVALNPRENLLVTNGVLQDSRNGELRGYTGRAGAGAHTVFSPDGTLCCEDFVLYDGKLARQYGRLSVSGETGGFTAAAFSHDSKLVGTAFGVWTTADQKIVWERNVDKIAFWPCGVAFTPDDKLLLIHDGRQLWISDVATGNVVATLTPQKQILGMALSADGAFLVTAPQDNSEPINVWRPGRRPAD